MTSAWADARRRAGRSAAAQSATPASRVALHAAEAVAPALAADAVLDDEVAPLNRDAQAIAAQYQDPVFRSDWVDVVREFTSHDPLPLVPSLARGASRRFLPPPPCIKEN